MRIYADTNFLTALFCGGPFEADATRLDAVAEAQGAEAYPVTLLTRLEFVNALQQSIYFTRNGVPGIRLTKERALVVEGEFFQHLSEGGMVAHKTVPESDIESQFQDLSHRHTAKEGFRTYDILHVSTALALGCDTFWSFDIKAKKLAKLEGLTVN